MTSMIRYDCAHLKNVTSNDILEKNYGSLRCDIQWAERDQLSRAGISCYNDCPRYMKADRSLFEEKKTPMSVIRDAFMSLTGKK
jgi:hypothetical protein